MMFAMDFLDACLDILVEEVLLRWDVFRNVIEIPSRFDLTRAKEIFINCMQHMLNSALYMIIKELSILLPLQVSFPLLTGEMSRQNYAGQGLSV
jgi:hypothetical protein